MINLDGAVGGQGSGGQRRAWPSGGGPDLEDVPGQGKLGVGLRLMHLQRYMELLLPCGLRLLGQQQPV